MCLFQDRTWISNVTRRGLFVLSEVSSDKMMGIRFVDFGGIVDHHYLNFSLHDIPNRPRLRSWGDTFGY